MMLFIALLCFVVGMPLDWALDYFKYRLTMTFTLRSDMGLDMR